MAVTPLTAPAIVPKPESCFIVSLPSGHLFFTVSMGMSSMRAPQKHRDVRACIARLPPQQRICHSMGGGGAAEFDEDGPKRGHRLALLSGDQGRALLRTEPGSFSARICYSFCNTEKHPPRRYGRGGGGIFLIQFIIGGEKGRKVPDETRGSCS